MRSKDKKAPPHPPVEEQKGPSLLANIKGLVKRTADQQKRIRIIMNPAAGQDQPSLNTFNAIFGESEYDWDVVLTKDAGDGQRLALQALADGIDIIAVHGGDGTVMEAACGLKNSQVPLAILPGGTGNVMAIELGIPRNLEDACKLIIANHMIRKIDMGLVNDRCFLLRVGIGLEAAVIEGAPRPAKDRYGIFAYIMSGIQAFREPENALYRLVIDGEEYSAEGIGCIVANAGNLGVLQGLNISPDVSVDDGLLDVFVIRRADLPSLLSLTASVVTGSENQEHLIHWKGRLVSVISDPPQTIQGDGEIFGTTPMSIKVLPQSLHVIVPCETAGETSEKGEETLPLSSEESG